MKIERIEDFNEFQSVKKEWNHLLVSSGQDSLFLTHEWFSAWWQSFGEKRSMEVLLFRNENGRLAGVAPLMVENKNLCFIASREVSDYCDFFSSAEQRETFYKRLLECYTDHFASLKRTELINVRASSPTLHYTPSLAPEYGLTCTVHEEEEVPGLDLPVSFDDYIGNLDRKNRHELRRKLRRTESLEGIKTRSLTDTRELLSSLEDFIMLHKESGLSKKQFWEKKGMERFFRELVIMLAPRQWIELNLLYAGKDLIAGLLHFSYANEILFYNSAFSRSYSQYNPGFYLFYRSLQQAISEKKKRADFLRGGEKYKYYFGGKTSKIFRLMISPREERT